MSTDPTSSPTFFKADMHCHTTCSDGSMSPEELLQHAVEIGLSGIAITDHDTTASFPISFPLAKKLGLSIITGVEFSSTFQNTPIHVLAYAFNPSSPDINALCERHKIRRKERNEAMLLRLARHNMPISLQDLEAAGIPSALLASQSYGRPHIAKAMIQKGYISSFEEAFKNYLGEGKSCYAEGSRISTEETIEIIHRAKGLAVLAHPHLIEKGAVVRKVIELPFNGLEGYYAQFPLSKQKKWVTLGESKGWIVTGGSDFHGTIKPRIRLGSSWVGENIFKAILEHQNRNLSA